MSRTKRKNNHIRHLVGNLSDCIESRYVHLLPSDRSAGMLFFLGGKENLFFFFPFWKWVDDCYLCVVLCAGARTLQGDVVCMLTSLAWRIVRRVNGQSSPAASQCTQSLLIIRQHLVSVSFLKFCFLLFKPRKLFLCQTPILILCFCFTTSSQKRLKNVDRNSCCRLLLKSS